MENMKKIVMTSLTGLVILGGCGTSADDTLEDSNKNGEQQEQTVNASSNEDNQKEQDNTTSNNKSSENDTEEKKSESKESEDSNEKKSNNNETEDGETDKSDDNNEETSQEEDRKRFDKGRAEVVLEDYAKAFNKVINYTTEDGQLKEYQTKPELKDHFRHFMSETQATQMIDTYFEMRDGKLHVKSMDGPTFLQTDQPYELNKVSEDKYQVVQERDNQLIGHVNMIYTLVHEDGIWIVKDVSREEIK